MPKYLPIHPQNKVVEILIGNRNELGSKYPYVLEDLIDYTDTDIFVLIVYDNQSYNYIELDWL